MDREGGRPAVPGRAGAGHLPRRPSTSPRRPTPCMARGPPGRPRGWSGAGRLLADGWPGLLDHVGATAAEGRTAAGQAAIDEMIGYFAKHTDRLGYFGRLRVGPVDRQRRGGGAGPAAGPPLKVSGRGWRVGQHRRDGDADRDGRHPGMGRTLGEDGRMMSRFESYTRVASTLQKSRRRLETRAKVWHDGASPTPNRLPSSIGRAADS